MEFKIEQSALKDELSFVQGIVEKKSTIPVLSNILIESVGENTIRIIGTDLDVTIRCEAEAEIIEGGSICLQARKIFDVVRLLPDSTLHFKKDENDWVKLSCGNSKYRFAGVSRDQFPELPVFKSAPLALPASVFNHFIMNTSFAITNEQSRFTLSGAKFMIEDGVARMVTTDGHRLALIEKRIETLGSETMDCLIPKKALIELVKVSRGTGAAVNFGEDQNHIYFEVDNRLLITRKLSGTFPNYEMVIPKDNDKRAEFNSIEFKDAVARVSLMADERTRSVKLTFKANEIEVTAHSSEEGEAVEKVEADYNGAEVIIGFNAQYLQDFLNVAASAESEATGIQKETDGEKVKVRESAGEPRVSMDFKDSNGQVQMRVAAESDYDYQYIVMPLRV